jgi:hypothetical protein
VGHHQRINHAIGTPFWIASAIPVTASRESAGNQQQKIYENKQ